MLAWILLCFPAFILHSSRWNKNKTVKAFYDSYEYSQSVILSGCKAVETEEEEEEERMLNKTKNAIAF